MEKDTKEALQVTKEIVIKFIEMDRISPVNLHEVFPHVYSIVHGTITGTEQSLKNKGRA